MRFFLIICGLLISGLANALPNRLFYVCDSLISDYYNNKDYQEFKAAWGRLPKEGIPLQSHQGFLLIALANADTTIGKTISLLVEKYGFDIAQERQSSAGTKDSSQNIFFCKRYDSEWDSLFGVWQRNNAGMMDFRREVTQFQAKERIVYPKYMQSEEDSLLKPSIDSLFDRFLAICQHQNALPNVERNGYGQDISIPLFHILSVSGPLLQERWNKIYPSVLNAFHAGEISNSYFFLYDRLLYRQCGKQFFGGMGNDVPIIDNADRNERKRQYLIDEAPGFLKINEQWKDVYDREQP
ncbi:MAG: hypothetical protein NC048_03280 [Bacteroides sp.]|nr:hypothetical protein [Ruminococcus flavefaciens]MCM1554497.1 hypothetical protein [Bacteroides sp.]